MTDSERDRLDDLIAKLETAPNGRGDLDADVAMAVGVPYRTRRNGQGKSKGREWFVDSIGGVQTWAQDPPAYTTSLDAALSLVPEGWCIKALREGDPTIPSQGNPDKQPSCQLRPLYDNGCGWMSLDQCRGLGHMEWGATLALALCIAALKARQAMAAPKFRCEGGDHG
jgi:hypothetical protein